MNLIFPVISKMVVEEAKNIDGEEHEQKTEERSDDINHRMQEAKEQIERDLEKMDQEMIENTQEYRPPLQARMDRTQELNQIPDEPIGYTEDMRVVKVEESEVGQERREKEKSHNGEERHMEARWRSNWAGRRRRDTRQRKHTTRGSIGI